MLSYMEPSIDDNIRDEAECTVYKQRGGDVRPSQLLKEE